MRLLPLLCLSGLLLPSLSGCAALSSQSEWERINYAEMSCGKGSKAPGCKPEDPNMSVISRGGSKGK